MNAYEITNTISGAYIGVYEGETPEEALDAMARDAGCSSYAEACETVPPREGEIVVKLVRDAD